MDTIKPEDDPNPPAAPAVPAPQPADQAEPADGKSTFVVTPRAGPRVAGLTVKAQQKIRLTEEEAQSELLSGAVVREGERLHEQLLANARPRAPKAA